MIQYIPALIYRVPLSKCIEIAKSQGQVTRAQGENTAFSALKKRTNPEDYAAYQNRMTFIIQAAFGGKCGLCPRDLCL